MIHLSLPGWNSLETVGTWARRFTVYGLICLMGVVIFDILAYIYQERKDELQAPRRITEQQKRLLATALPYKGQSVAIYTLIGNTESMVYGQDFVDVFSRAQWKVEFVPRSTWDITFDGLAIATLKDRPVPEEVSTFKQEAIKLNIAFASQSTDTLPPNAIFEIWVTERHF